MPCASPLVCDAEPAAIVLEASDEFGELHLLMVLRQRHRANDGAD